MADFCVQCAKELNFPRSDFEGLDRKEGFIYSELCEHCGPTWVDWSGNCVGPCSEHHEIGEGDE